MQRHERYGHQAGDRIEVAAVALRAILAVLSCGLFAAWVMRMLGRIRYPYELSYGEGALLYQALRLARGGRMYSPTDGLPYVPNVYGPVYPLLWAPLAAIAGPTFWPGRALAAISSLSVAACIYWLVVRDTGDRLAGLIALGVWASATPTYLWGALARVDMLALTLALIGFGIATSDRGRWRWLSVAFFVVSVYTKQSMLAAPVATYAWMALRGRRRDALEYAVAWVGGCLVILGALTAVTGGGAWREIIGGAIMHPWSLQNLLSALHSVATNDIVLAFVAPAMLALAVSQHKSRGLALYAVVAALVTVAAGKAGAALNYFLEPMALVAALCGLGVARERGLLARGSVWTVALMVLIGAQFASRLWTMSPGAWHISAGASEESALIAAIARAPGPVLSEDMGAALQAHKTLWVEPFANTHLAQRGLWDQRPLVAMIERRQFSLIVVGSSWQYYLQKHTAPPDQTVATSAMFTTEQLEAMARSYRVQGTIGDRTLLVPR